MQIALLMQSYNIFHTVEFPTRISKNTGTAIDNIFMDNARINSFKVTPLINGLSDHDAQCLVINNIFNLDKQTIHRVKFRLINKDTIQNFLDNLTNETWEDVYKLNEVNEIFNLFLHTFIIIYESSFPTQNLTLNCKNNGWITQGIRLSCRHKQSLYIFSRNSNNYLIKLYYKLYCSILRKVIREAKSIYYNHLISSSDNKIKTTWRIIETESGKSRTNERLPHNFQMDNNKISYDEAAQTFCKYFTALAENLNPRHAEAQTAMTYLTSSFPTGFPVMKISPVTEIELSKIINTLKSKKSSGYDGISNKMLK
jgi:ribosomal protein L33